MTSNGKAIPARRLRPFRPSRILAEMSEADVTWKWWFRLQRLSFSGDFIDVVEGKVEASKTSAKMARANVAFHGQGLCSYSRNVTWIPFQTTAAIGTSIAQEGAASFDNCKAGFSAIDGTVNCKGHAGAAADPGLILQNRIREGYQAYCRVVAD
jgi:hypothetical protein